MTIIDQDSSNDAVLSSLRRLVGGEGKPASVTGRLVLTRAERCDVPSQPLILSQKQKLPCAASLPTPNKRRAELERTIATLEAAVLKDGAKRLTKTSPPPAAQVETKIRKEVVASSRPSDEELRGLVADCVETELRGDTGARATRNLRLLVRQEIYSILASEGLLKR